MAITNENVYATINMPWKGMSDLELSANTTTIATAMVGNANFPTLAKKIADYQTQALAFPAQVAVASDRDKGEIDKKNKMRKELISSTITLGSAVAAIANGNVDVLRSTNFPLRKRRKTTVIVAPEGLVLTVTHAAGVLKMKVKAVGGATAYIFQYALLSDAPADAWTSITCTRTKCTATGLTSGSKVYVKVAAIGPNHQVQWCQPVLSPYIP